MATNAITINVVGVNGNPLPAATDFVVTSLGTYATDNTYSVSGAVCTVYVPKGQNTNAYTNYQVTDTLAEVIAALNTDTVADLSVVGSLSVGNDLSVTDDATIGGDLAVTGTSTFTGTATFNDDVTLGAGDDLTGSSTSNILGFNTIAPLATKPTLTAVNVSATVTGAQLKGGGFSSTSAAAVALTLPTATDSATALGAVAGSYFDFVVSNVAGANTVTVQVNTGITAASDLTGGTDLTVSASATVGIGVFRLTFFSTTGAILSRIA